jgi:hypothetical protein
LTVSAPPCSVDDLLHDASRCLAAGLREEARRLLVDATCVDPLDARPTIELAELLSESDPEQALRWLRRAVELEPDSPGLHARLAQMLASRVRSPG